MPTFNVSLREAPAGAQDFKVDLDAAGLFVGTMSIDGHVNRTRTFLTQTNRGFGFYPIIGQRDGFESP